MISTPQIGAVLQGRYSIVGLLGQGAMGRVLKAEDLRLPGRLCAVKEMVPTTAYTPKSLAEARQQFQVEAQILAKLDHPNLPKVSDYFTEGGRDYLVMDFVEGQDLEEVLEQASDFFSKMFDNPVEIYTGQLKLDLMTGKVEQYLEEFRSEWVAVDPAATDKDKEPDMLRMGAIRIYRIERID